MNLCRWILPGLFCITFLGCGITDWFGEEHDNEYEYVNDGWEFLTIPVPRAWNANYHTMTVFNNKIYYTHDTTYIYTSTDAGSTWKQWYNGNYLFVSLYSDSASLFICTDQGIYIMNKDETTPRQVSLKKKFKITASRDNYLFAVTEKKEGFISSDRGVTWKQLLGGDVFMTQGQLFDGDYLYTAKFASGGSYVDRISLSDYTTKNIKGNLPDYVYVLGFTKVGPRIFASTGSGIYYLEGTDKWSGFWDRSMSSPLFNCGNSVYGTSYSEFVFTLDSGNSWQFHKINYWSVTGIFEFGDYVIGYSGAAIYRKLKRDI